MAYIGRDIQYGTFTKQTLTADSSATDFTLDQGVADATNLLVSVGGVIQEPNIAYTAAGTDLVFTAAPTTGDAVYLIYLGKELTVTNIADGTVTDSKIVDMTASKLTGALPAISGASLTSLTSSNLTGALPAISGASLTSLTSSNLTGALPAISGASLTSLDATSLIAPIGELNNIIGSTGGGTQDIDLTLGTSVTATVDTSTNTFTFSNPTTSSEGCGFTLVLVNGGSQTVVWPASVDWPAATAPTLTVAGTDILTFFTVDGGTIWHGMSSSIGSA